MSDVVRTRFAPSPTGHLHVGGARTALFNYLLARRAGGRFLLRIEDTDQARNVPGAEAKLLEDLRWLGLTWDEGPQVGGPYGPYHQSQRLSTYQEHARRLLDAGAAYYAFDTRQELDAMRAEAQRQKRNFRYPRPARFPSEADAQRARDAGRPVVVRFRMPEREFVVRDAILGEVRFSPEERDDFVLVKADGWPTYHFAVVVDDELMRITHVLRGQEHLMNTPNHIALQEAFGYRTPVYAHLPIILNMDGSKMSKREKDRAVRAALDATLAAGTLDETRAAALAGFDDPAAFAEWRGGRTPLEPAALERLARALNAATPEIEIHDFRVSGYLPEVLVNFIALLGWSAGDGRERYSLAELVEAFAVERIGRTNARFDREKLLSFNTTACAEAEPARLLAGMRDYLSVNPPGPLSGLDDATLARLIAACRGFRVFREIDSKCRAMFADDAELVYDPAAVKKVLLRNDGAGLADLARVAELLERAEDWSAPGLEALLKGFAEANGLGLARVAQPLRVAVTGTTVSPPIFETLALMGRERVLRRIRVLRARLTADPAPP